MAAPELVYPLSCLFNRQIMVHFDPDLLKEWRDIFMDFYSCEDLGQVGREYRVTLVVADLGLG